jgi:glyoxylase-like metal-dependent hydrolase (beta-lactamase superfamily II)
MIQTYQSGEVRVFRMARSLFGRAVYFTAAYWVDGLLVDTGCFYTERELLSCLEGLPLEWVVNTHSHEDHVGGNGAVQRRFGTRVLVHPSAISLLAAPGTSRVLRPYQKVMWGYPAPSEALPIGERVETSHHVFQVIHTPGHSPDHISLFEPTQGWLFCGDAYVGGRDRALRADYNIWQIIASLKKMAARDVEWLFPGSGKVRDKAAMEIAEKIRYLEETGEEVLALHRKCWGYGRIRRRLFGRESTIAYITLGHFSGRHLVRSFVEDKPATLC